MEKKKNGLWLYLILVFILSWGFCFGVIYPAVNRGGNYANYAIGLMFFPALSVALTRLITKEGFQNCLLRPRFKGHIRYYLLAWLGPGLLVILGAALYFLLFPAQLDWSSPLVREQMAAAGAPYEAQALPMSAILAIQAVQALLLAGILNFIPALGEEWGWRGYLYPRLTERFGRRKAALLGGLIWGLWHAPVIALGHNYGLGYPGYPWTGIAAMCVLSVALGTLLMWLTSMTGSCLPAALAHGAFNGAASLSMLVSADEGNHFVGPLPTGVIGGAPILIAAAIVFFRFAQTERREEGAFENRP